jgi:hypothetical protein
MTGYLEGYARRRPRAADETLVSFVRRQQLRRLSFRGSLWR